MTKLFLTVLLFLLALTLLALNPDDFKSYMDHTNIKLAHGVQVDSKPLVWDFSNKYYWANWLEVEPRLYAPIEPHSHMGPYATWYSNDFAEDPFDGRIEVYVVGEPLPSARATFLITLITAGIILWNCPSLHKT